MEKIAPEKKLHLLHFLLKQVRICIELKYVTKVLPLVELETVPGGPAYLAGLMNLAGKSIPIIDLALRLGLDRHQSYSLNIPVLLCSNESNQAGIIVDEILGLVDVDENALQMRTDFDKDSPFYATINIGTELSLLINLPQILAISLTTEKNNLIFDTHLVSMAKHE